MRGSLVSDLGLEPEVWLFLSLLGCVTLFFKFSRIWSIRNLDLLLLFVLVPGMMLIVGDQTHPPWSAFIWLFLGSAFWLVRCLLDLGLSRRPLLEPNLNASGLLCLSIGILGLLLAETVSLPVHDGAARNPAEPAGREDRPVSEAPERPAGWSGQAGHRALASPLAQAGACAGHRFPGARGACPQWPGGRALPDRLEALRAAHRRHGDGGVLPASSLHANGRGGQRPVDLGGADHPGRLLALAALGHRSAHRPGRRLDSRLPGPDRALGRVLPGPRNVPVPHRRLLRGRGLRIAGGLDSRAGHAGLGPSAPAASPRLACCPGSSPSRPAASGPASIPAFACPS